MWALPIFSFCLIQLSNACFPAPFGFRYGAQPMPSPVYYPSPMMGPYLGPRMMTARSEQQASSHDAFSNYRPKVEMMMDEPQTLSTLNCPLFAEANFCRWRNNGEDELEWAPVSRVVNAEQWFPYLESQTNPDQLAGALISGPKQGWEGGRLESDFLPCIGNGIRLTATVWRSKNANPGDEPKLQVCTRNRGEERMPLINCVDFEIRNGVPMTADVPPANELQLPAQIIINGYNFMGPAGGALFLQDIVMDGTSSCSDSSPNVMSVARDESHKPNLNDGSSSMVGMNGREDSDESLISIDSISSMSSSPFQDSMSSLYRKENLNSIMGMPNTAPTLIPPTNIQKLARNSATYSPTLFESCLALSCNPSDLNCKFWRSAGTNLWEIGSTSRLSNPLTGIATAPGSAQKFLVASFMDPHTNNYVLVSESLYVPLRTKAYFCFYEYFATEGMTLSICTDKMDCFYSKNNLSLSPSLEENKKWNIRCAKLPEGHYQMRVIAENRGQNKGEVGFLPIRLSRDLEGLDFIC